MTSGVFQLKMPHQLTFKLMAPTRKMRVAIGIEVGKRLSMLSSAKPQTSEIYAARFTLEIFVQMVKVFKPGVYHALRNLEEIEI